MTAIAPTIELPRIDGESARAYAARVEYVTMGPARSIDKVTQQLGGKSGVRSTRFMEWSAKYGWVESARQYDDQIHYLTLQEAAAKHLVKLEQHRDRADGAGEALYTVASQFIKRISEMLAQPQTIEGKDGKTYRLHNIEFNANSFAVAARAMQTALDLKAHALGVDKLLPSLEQDDSE